MMPTTVNRFDRGVYSTDHCREMEALTDSGAYYVAHSMSQMMSSKADINKTL
jgi:hypothetical protein